MDLIAELQQKYGLSLEQATELAGRFHGKQVQTQARPAERTAAPMHISASELRPQPKPQPIGPGDPVYDSMRAVVARDIQDPSRAGQGDFRPGDPSYDAMRASVAQEVGLSWRPHQPEPARTRGPTRWEQVRGRTK